ncbi:MAG: hypothetical protein JWM80_2292 [Cyanobacteria bacterium RYN_339]|nr:hypothetical protein [Cyanobacteria bacterium RYN_339]
MGSNDNTKKWGGARQGAGRPAKQPGHRRPALSVTVTDTHWAAVHLFAQHHGQSASEVLDGMIGCALAGEPYASFFASWYATHTLDETLQHLAQGRERIVPKAPAQES